MAEQTKREQRVFKIAPKTPPKKQGVVTPPEHKRAGFNEGLGEKDRRDHARFSRCSCSNFPYCGH